MHDNCSLAILKIAETSEREIEINSASFNLFKIRVHMNDAKKHLQMKEISLNELKQSEKHLMTAII